MTNVFHSSDTDSWGTPREYIEAAREVMGDIDLDPASSAEWNAVVDAFVFYDEGDNGLERPWAGNVWLNPPGGKYPKGHPLGGQSKAGLFWAKLMYELRSGGVDQAVVCCFSLNQLQSTQGGVWRSMAKFPFCLPRKRVAYVNAAGDAKSPPHASAFIYVPGQVDNTQKFCKVFSRFGVICNGGL